MTDEQYELKVDDVKSRAHGRWNEMLRCLGVDDRILSGKNMPCPLCGGTDRFQYTDRFQEGNYHCRNPDCGPRGGFKLLQAVTGWDFPTALRKVHECVGGPSPKASDHGRARGAGTHGRSAGNGANGTYAGNSGNGDSRCNDVGGQQPVERMKQLARRIWDEAAPVRAGDAVDRYLSGRGLGLDAYPTSLRCHPKLGYYERIKSDECGDGGEGSKNVKGAKSQRVAEYTAMLARIDGPDGELISLHRTYLDGGRRAALPDAKKVLSTGINGAAIRLFAFGEVLAVAEGIETALAVHLLRNLPVWAGLSAGNLERLWIPPQVRQVLIFGDNDADAGFDGEASAYALARRLRKEAHHGLDREVQVLLPRKHGVDWADVWFSVVRHMKRAV